MANIISGISHPELVIGIAGPIGIDIEAITASIEDSLSSVGYRSTQIRITDEVKDIQNRFKAPAKTDYYSVIRFKMNHASEICRKNRDSAYLMRIAIDAIQRERAACAQAVIDKSKTKGKKPLSTDSGRVSQKIAYIIRQIKRPQEVVVSQFEF